MKLVAVYNNRSFQDGKQSVANFVGYKDQILPNSVKLKIVFEKESIQWSVIKKLKGNSFRFVVEGLP